MIFTAELADTIGITEERLLGSLKANLLPVHSSGGMRFVSVQIAEQISAIYRNATPETPSRPTPWNLREEYRPSERRGEETERNC